MSNITLEPRIIGGVGIIGRFDIKRLFGTREYYREKLTFSKPVGQVNFTERKFEEMH